MNPAQESQRPASQDSHTFYDKIAQFYNDRAPNYDTEPNSFHPALAEDFVQWAHPFMPKTPKPPISILDLCCGTGLVSFAALNHFGPDTTIHGVDISTASMAIAQQKALLNPHAANVRFLEGSATELESLPLQKETYSLITCCSAFVLLPGDRESILKAWAKYLRPGGVVIFDVPAPETQLVTLLTGRVLARYGAPAVERDWVESEASVRGLISGAGLEVGGVLVSEVYRREEYRVAEAEGIWDKASGHVMSDAIALSDGDRESAKQAFVRMMRDRGGEGGVVRDEIKFLIGIGVKPS